MRLSAFCISKKLSKLKKGLRGWSRNSIGNIHDELPKLEKVISEMQHKEVTGGLTGLEEDELREATAKYHNAL